MDRVPNAVAVLATAGLVVVASQGPVFGLIAIILAALALALVALGPHHFGLGLMVAAYLAAPMDDLRPSAAVSVVNVSDLLLVMGTASLLPTMLRRRSAVPFPYALGSLLIVGSLGVSSLLTPEPSVALLNGARLVAATVVIPFAILLWRPSPRVVVALAWAYVAGQVISTFYAAGEGQAVNDRYDGLSTHFNFFGLGGLLSICLLLFLHQRTSRASRWLVWACGAICLASIAMSGSRAAAIVVGAVLIIFPIVERSLASAYVLLVGCGGVLLFGIYLYGLLNEVSFLERFSGDDTTKISDLNRQSELSVGIERFLARPIRGNGFDEQGLAAHNIYLQVAVGIGIVGLVGFLIIMAMSIAPLIRRHSSLARLGYVGLGYAAIGMLTNSLWDRFVWLPVALALLSVRPTEGTDPDATKPAIRVAGSRS